MKSLPSTSSNHKFSEIPKAEIQRSAFNRSHGYKTTFDAGLLIPIYVDEALPGDSINLSVSSFARLATAIAPVMDNMTMDFFFFAVPNRLVWDNWQRFCGEQDTPGASTDYTIPQVVAPAVTGFPELGVADYFGLPVHVGGLSVGALHFRAYNLIWNQWFRDENLMNPVTVNKGNAADDYSLYTVLRRGKRHDYFTSCLPWPQKGPGVEIPLGSTAPIIGTGQAPTFYTSGAIPGTAQFPLYTNSANAGSIPDYSPLELGTSAGGMGTVFWGTPALMADLSEASAATINSLRQAFQIQKLLERDARGGTRYVEILRSHFGVVSPDARLQRAEYLGGGSVPITFNPVTQTSASLPTETPQGNLAAYAVAGANNIGFTKSFVEHCVVIGMVCIRADLSYQQGLHRMWSRTTRWDFFWPAFSHLGEQAVLSKEIFCLGEASDQNVFGYQERWAEYRYYPSQITGAFRHNFPGGSLDFWHLAQYFETRPRLDDHSFIEEHPPIERVVAVPTEPHFIFDSYFNIKTVRPMPTYSVPGLIDHF